jgi:diacylglycerol kinase (ATP)
MHTEKRLLVLVNPGAGSGQVDLIRALLEHELQRQGWAYDFELLAKGVPITDVISRLHHAVGQGASRLIACGGDGTISLAAAAIIKADLATKLTLGIFPAGTANSLAKELGLPGDWQAVATLLCSEIEPTSLDAMKMDERYCFLRIGIGIDAETIQETSREAKKQLGRWAYLRSFLTRLFRPHRIRFTVIVDNHRHNFWAVQVFLANGGNIALAPFRIGPDIRFNDGIVNLCAYDALSWWDYFTVGWKLFRKNYDEHPLLKFYLVKKQLQVKCKPVALVQADGEACAKTPIHMEVIPAAIKVLAPVQKQEA